jgi:acetyltransferase-like isoleucine patch superfamily enzyme
VSSPTFADAPPRPAAFAHHGERTWLVPPIHVTGSGCIEIGDDVVIMEHLTIEVAPGARLRIGDGVRLGRFVTITCADTIDIGPGVSSSDYVGITDGWGRVEPLPGEVPPPGGPVRIDDGAYLGAGSVVGPGVHVGAGAFVGEGAVVLDDVPAHSVVYGNVGRVVRRHHPSTGWEGPRFG